MPDCNCWLPRRYLLLAHERALVLCGICFSLSGGTRPTKWFFKGVLMALRARASFVRLDKLKQAEACPTECPASPCGPPTTMKLILRCPSTGCGRMGLLRCPAMIDAQAVPTSVGQPASIHAQL